jgi:ribulose-phosphate 3-epimerase
MKYLCDPHIIPAVMPHDFAQLSAFAEQFAEFADTIHLDVMDGDFAPNPGWPLASDEQKKEFVLLTEAGPSLPAAVSFEVHLMTRTPREFGELFARAGAARVIAHIEAFERPEEVIQALADWKAAGAREVGLSIKIDTPLRALEEVASLCDVIQVMSIAEIGYQGKAFDERALSRVEELHALYPDMMVSVDGGVSEGTVELLVRAGANRLVVGGALASSSKPAMTYARIHERAMLGCVPVNSEREAVNS